AQHLHLLIDVDVISVGTRGGRVNLGRRPHLCVQRRLIDGRAGLGSTDGLIENVFEIDLRGFEAGRIHVGDVVGDRALTRRETAECRLEICVGPAEVDAGATGHRLLAADYSAKLGRVPQYFWYISLCLLVWRNTAVLLHGSGTRVVGSQRQALVTVEL